MVRTRQGTETSYERDEKGRWIGSNNPKRDEDVAKAREAKRRDYIEKKKVPESYHPRRRQRRGPPVKLPFQRSQEMVDVFAEVAQRVVGEAGELFSNSMEKGQSLVAVVDLVQEWAAKARERGDEELACTIERRSLQDARQRMNDYGADPTLYKMKVEDAGDEGMAVKKEIPPEGRIVTKRSGQRILCIGPFNSATMSDSTSTSSGGGQIDDTWFVDLYPEGDERRLDHSLPATADPGEPDEKEEPPDDDGPEPYVELAVELDKASADHVTGRLSKEVKTKWDEKKREQTFEIALKDVVFTRGGLDLALFATVEGTAAFK